jgi:3-oxoacyl-[acyl-carrier protein] reductase
MVTGAAQGIGHDIARAFASHGHKVALLDRSDHVERAAEGLRNEGGQARALALDITDEGAVAKGVREIISVWGEIGVLVNNAGITGRKGAGKTPVEEMDPADWDRVIQTNVTAAFLLCKAVLPSMQQAHWGRVISMASQAARARTERSNAHYAASKAALMGFSRGLALEVASDGITVNCIAPGRISTPMTAQTGPKVDAIYAEKSAVGRVGAPSDIAAAALFLAAEESSFITGTTLDVNGGYSMN